MPPPTGDVAEALREQGWDGRCSLWESCRGERCGGRDPAWRSWAMIPPQRYLPEGFDRRARTTTECPAGRWSWLLVLWRDCGRTGRLPMGGELLDQPAWLMAALSTLDAEEQLIRLAHQADAEEAARARNGGRHG